MDVLPWSLTNLGFYGLLGSQKCNQDMELLCVEPLLSLLDHAVLYSLDTKGHTGSSAS